MQTRVQWFPRSRDLLGRLQRLTIVVFSLVAYFSLKRQQGRRGARRRQRIIR